MERWAGRVAVVTGASTGIGAAIVKDLVNHGLIVVGIARRVQSVQELAKQLEGSKGKLYAVKADVKIEKEILDAFAWIEKNTPGVDILINNAGVAHTDNLIDGSTEAWKEMFDVNVIALSVCAREALKSMKKKKADDGIIININSIAGRRLFTKLSMYSASKFAVAALSEALHKEIEDTGHHIRVTNISPGMVETEMLTNWVGKINYPMDYSCALRPADIANAVNFIIATDSNVFETPVRNTVKEFNKILKLWRTATKEDWIHTLWQITAGVLKGTVPKYIQECHGKEVS